MQYEKYLNLIEQQKDTFIRVSDDIWEYAETAYRETRSAARMADELEKIGFTVERGIVGIPTALRATFGSGKPVIAIQAEYDALGGGSQQAGVAEPKPIPGKQTGHGCGHNLFAGGSLAAALAVKSFVEETGKGTVVFMGCPAEEGGAGKTFMVRDGAYEGIDAVISWHPEQMHMVRTRPSLANIGLRYTFDGIASHAGGAPWKGRSALDAAELMNIGVQYLREHMTSDCRVHYAFLDCGGTAPNVVQPHVEMAYTVRASTLPAVRELKERVERIAEGAALMTDTKMSSRIVSAYSDLITIPTLQKVGNEALHDIPVPVPNEEDLAFAKALQATMQLTEEQKNQPPYPTAALDPAPPVAHGGSTDTADVSWVCPTLQFHIATKCIGTPGHSWQNQAQGKSHYAHEGLIFAGKVVAQTVMRLFDDPELLAAAKAEHFAKTKGHYQSPIPADLKPNLPQD